MDSLSDKVSFDINYLPSQSDRSFIKKSSDVHPLSLQGDLSIKVNDKIVARDVVAILELLTYCQEWDRQNKNRRQVRDFVYMSMEHEDEAILKFQLDNGSREMYSLQFFGGPRLAKVDSKKLTQIIVDLKNDLIDACLKSELSSLQLRTYLGIDVDRKNSR